MPFSGIMVTMVTIFSVVDSEWCSSVLLLTKWRRFLRFKSVCEGDFDNVLTDK